MLNPDLLGFALSVNERTQYLLGFKMNSHLFSFFLDDREKYRK